MAGELGNSKVNWAIVRNKSGQLGTGNTVTVYSGLSGSGLTGKFGLSGKKAWSFEIPCLLQCIYSGLSGSGLTGKFGLSGIKFRSLEAKCIVFTPVYPVFIFTPRQKAEGVLL